MLNDSSILVTGGTGSFGQAFIKAVLREFNPAKVIVYSRDELKQAEMRNIQLLQDNEHIMRYFIGDIRDKERIKMAMYGVDYVIHSAALKQVPALEYNPFEAIKTNILGTQNVVEASIDADVKNVIALSTDKAAAPINLYGATKLAADKLVIAGNNIVGRHKTKFAVVRYGNVFGSRGSVAPLFISLKETGQIPITDPRMTRFSITLDQGVEFVLASLRKMLGGELFVPKIPSFRILDLAEAIAPDAEITFKGIRPGEKLHEEMITKTDAMTTIEHSDHFIILPSQTIGEGSTKNILYSKNSKEYRKCEEQFYYSSDTNPVFLDVADLRKLVKSCF